MPYRGFNPSRAQASRCLVNAVLAAGAVLTCLPCHAASPLTTDDPAVLTRGSVERELYLTDTRLAGTTARSVAVQAGLGLGGASQFNLSAARHQAHDHRLGAVGLRGKTVLREGGEDETGGVAVALGYGAAWTREAGRWQGSGADVVALIGMQWRSGTTLLVNVGHARSSVSHRHATLWGVAVEQAASQPVTLVAEVFGDDHAAPCWAAGVRWQLPVNGLTLGATWGASLERPRARSLTAGLTWATP